MKKYPIVCKSCNGEGYICHSQGIHASTTKECPACKGLKIVIVEED